MLLHLFSAAQDEDIRSKSASVFIFSHFVMLVVHTLKNCQMHTTGKGDFDVYSLN